MHGTANDPEWPLHLHRVNLVRRVAETRTLGYRVGRAVTGGRRDPKLGYRVNFAELQRMRMRKLQVQLTREAFEMKATGKETTTWELSLQTYIQAVQEYDFMMKAALANDDPFVVSSERSRHDAEVLEVTRFGMDTSPEDADDDEVLKNIIHVGLFSREGMPIWNTRHTSAEIQSRQTRTWRMMAALFGGAFILAPMWLMVKKRDLPTDAHLGFVSGFVAGFGFLTALVLEKPIDVVASTAGYAAVLMVFVGVFLTNDTS